MSARGSARSKTKAILPGSMTLKSFAFNLLSPPARNFAGRGSQDGEGSQAGIYHHGEFFVEAEAWGAEGIHGAGPRHDWCSGAKHSAEDVLVSRRNTASKLI